jgi:hypothetical protein
LSGALDIGLDAEHPLLDLPIVSGLNAGEPTFMSAAALPSAVPVVVAVSPLPRIGMPPVVVAVTTEVDV